MNNISKFLIIYVLLIFTACSNKNDYRLQEALSLAGKNRIELKKVLKRYSKNATDSLKYKAACFLIENMPGYYYYEGEVLENYSTYFKWLDDNKKRPGQIIESLEQKYGVFDISKLKVKHDIQEIDSAYLCENIDLSFEVWKKFPWCKNISFNDFCEYILPYRIGNEKITNWRKKYLDKYGAYLDTIKTENPVTAARNLRKIILDKRGEPRFTVIRPNGYPNIDALTAEAFNGSCDDISWFTLFLFRCVGIPCTIDYIPLRGNDNVGHSWVSIKNHKGEFYFTDFFSNIAFISENSGNRLALKTKAYRKTFSKNRDAIKKISEITHDTPKEFSDNNYRFIDVTYLYTNFLSNIEIQENALYPDKRGEKLVYLCMSSKLEWIPVDWSIINNNSYVFNIESGCVSRLANYENGKLIFVSDPFIVQRQSREIHFFKLKKGEYESVTLFSKFPLRVESSYRNRMIGGVFEGCNNPQFQKADTIHVIKGAPSRLLTTVSVSPLKEYRYVRYKGPSGSYCNIAEVQFFSDSVYLTGKVIGTPGSLKNDGSREYTNVFDGSTNTSFDHNTPSDGWAGLDLSTPKRITKIVYSPRNSDNYIKEGQKYELFYSGKEGWKSLGQQVATSDSLNYDNVPTGTLYYLKNYSSGVQERIFNIEEGKPIFK
ncbi:MAG: discoidin domain-containing protein [Porphyromonadaceae bacterium]|nr:discoidin domain-containing protein [Porphyromonadaceae bacterium]